VTIGVVTGLADEAGCLSGCGRAVRVLCGGPGPARAAAAARGLIADGAATLVSFGVAGALAPGLRAGELVLAGVVVFPNGRRVAAEVVEPPATGRVHRGLLAGSDVPVLTPAAKRRLFDDTGALAVDMESHAVAAAAHAAGLPFVALRAIVDASDQAVPDLALAGMGADGRTRALPVVRGLLRRPGALPGLLRLRRDMRAALAALREVAPELEAMIRGGTR